MSTIVHDITLYVSHAAELIACLVIGVSIVKVLIDWLRFGFVSTTSEKIRLQFGSAVSIALELLLGADVLATAIAPTWSDIGQLAAIATLRTLLNYFLDKELKHRRPESSKEKLQ